MDGRRRLAEPVTDGAQARPAAGAAPAARRMRVRAEPRPHRLRPPAAPLARSGRRTGGCRAAPASRPRSCFVLASIGFGVVRGGHVPAIAGRARATCATRAANALGFRITSIALAGQQQLTREEILAIAGVTGRTLAAVPRRRRRARPAQGQSLDRRGDRAQALSRPAAHRGDRARGLRALAEGRQGFGDLRRRHRGRALSSAQRFAKLPLVVGAGAETRAKDFLALLDKYPLVRDQMRAAVLVAERRWNVVLKNGIDVRLPETERRAGARHAGAARPRQEAA